jgi:hypothetical protein
MARLPLIVYPAARGGTVITWQAPQITGSGGNSFVNNGDTVFTVINAHAATPCNVSIARTRTVDGTAPVARLVTVAALTSQVIGDLATDDFNHADGTVYVDMDFVTSVTCTIVQP